MTLKQQLDELTEASKTDTEWLGKYKRIVDGLQQIAEIMSDATSKDLAEWTTISEGLRALSDLMKEDIDGRKEDAQ